jgi:putative SOS response-associated peptidase YedK
VAESRSAVQILIMCGRYRRTTQEEEFARRYGITIPAQTDLPISWNIAPSQQVLAIRLNPETGQRSLNAIRWGLVPSWAQDEKIAYRTINARVETIETAPSFRAAFLKRRCLIPADGFYEWKKVLGGKAPFSIGLKSGAPFVFAGLWEGWKRPGTEDWLRTCTIITGEPNELVREIHTRMPVILPLEYQEGWLSGAVGKEVLTPYPAEEMTAWEIGPRVNSPRYNDSSIIEPVSLDRSGIFGRRSWSSPGGTTSQLELGEE